MRNILLFLFLIFLFGSSPFIASAQLTSGLRTFQHSGELLFQTQDGSSLLFVNYTGEQGKMVNDRIMLGAGAGGSVIAADGTSFGLTATPFARLYLNPESPTFNAFIGLEAQIISGFGDGESNTNFAVFPHLGANVFVQPTLSLRGRAGLQIPFTEGASSIFNVRFDFEPFFSPEQWGGRKGQTYALSDGNFFLEDPSLDMSFVQGTNVIGLNTLVGYMVSELTAIGIDFAYQNVGEFLSLTELEAMVRYYLSQSHTSWFLHAQGGPNIVSIQDLFGGGRISTTAFSFTFGGGFTTFLDTHTAVNMRFGLNIVSGDEVDNTKGLVGSLGMQYTFGQN